MSRILKKIIIVSIVLITSLNAFAIEVQKPSANLLTCDGLEQAFDGQFNKSLDMFRQAKGSNTNDPNLAESVSILEQYVKLKSKMDTGRTREFLQIVQRIERAVLSEKNYKKLSATGMDKKLRKHFDKVMDSYKNMSPVNDLLEMNVEKAEATREKTIKVVTQATQAVGNFKEILKGDKSDYALTFNILVDDFAKASEKYCDAWRTVKLKTDKERQNAVRKLWSMEYDLAILLGNIEFMTVKQPWRIAMSQLVLASTFVDHPEELKGKDWFDKTIKLVREKGDEAFADEEWYDAMWAYSSLSELFTGDKELRNKSDDIKRYVRVMNLYGNGDKKDSDDEDEDNDEEAQDEATWEEIVAGAKADLVGKVIDYLSSYVARIDFRAAARSGITAIKILAEVEDSSESFPKFRDAKVRKEFIERLDRLTKDIEKRDRVSQMDLQMVFNSILVSAQKIAEIPPEVVAVEFTDGMLKELDRFTSVIWPYDVEEFQKQIRGKFVGAGIRISKERNEHLKVVRPIEDTPAFRAGIKRGDFIVAVDGTDTKKYTVDRLVRMIMGKEGTKVVLRIKREGVLNPFDVTIVRQPIVIKTVKGWKRKRGGDWDFMLDREMGIGYIRLTQFGERTAKDLTDALRQLQAAGAESMILDLRFNPGGRLDCAIDVADQFLAGGKIVATGKNVINAGRYYRKAGRNGLFQDGNLIILVNESSASAAEIVSGALQDQKRGIVIGERSYGKGSVQTVLPLRWNPAARMPIASFKMTTAYYYLPSTRLLHRKPGAKDWGVSPDIGIRFGPKQRRKWLELRYDTDVRSAMSTTQLNGELEDQIKADLQLNTAVTLLKLMKLNKQQLIALKAKKAA